MGFKHTHSSWTYIQHKLLMSSTSANRRQIATYYNDTGADKVVTSVTMNLGVACGYVPSDDGGSELSCTGAAITAYLTINGVNSDVLTISNKCYPVSGTWYNTSSCQNYTFTFSGRPRVNSGVTQPILITVSNSTATDQGLVSPKTNPTGTVADPYTAPSYSINSVSPSIGIHSSTSFTVNYTISGGTNSLDWVIAKVYNSSNSHIGSVSLSTSKGTNKTASIKLPSACSDGQSYKISVRFSDNQAEYETGTKTIYTYRTPKISDVIMTDTSFSRYR